MRTRRLRETAYLREMTELVSEYSKADPLFLTVRGKRRNLSRSVAIYLARRHTFEDNHKIERNFNMGYTPVSHVVGS